MNDRELSVSVTERSEDDLADEIGSEISDDDAKFSHVKGVAASVASNADDPTGDGLGLLSPPTSPKESGELSSFGGSVLASTGSVGTPTRLPRKLPPPRTAGSGAESHSKGGPNLAGSSKSGFLNKKGKLVGKWQKVFCVLRGGFLEYYLAADSGGEGGKGGYAILSVQPHKKLHLLDASVDESSGKSKRDHTFTVNVRIADKDGRALLLQAPSSQEKTAWAQAIRTESEAAKAGENARQWLKEKKGWMSKKGGVKGEKGWNRKWFLLSGSLLHVYNKSDDKPHEPKTTIDLKKAYLVRQSATERPLGFQLVSIANDGKLYKVCSLCANKYSKDGSQLATQVWQHKTDVEACPICTKKFSVINRKHHCRQCGRVVCAECCKARLPIEGERTFYLDPETDTERNDWLHAIEVHLGMRTPVLRSGFLMMRYPACSCQGIQHNKWHKHFFALRPGRLSFYAQIKDHLPPECELGQISLVKANLIRSSEFLDRPSAFQILPLYLSSSHIPHQSPNGQTHEFITETSHDARARSFHLDLPTSEERGVTSRNPSVRATSVQLSPGSLQIIAGKSAEGGGSGGAGERVATATALGVAGRSNGSSSSNLHSKGDDAEGWDEEVGGVGGGAVLIEDWMLSVAVAIPHKCFDVPLALAAERTDEVHKVVPSPIRVATEWLNIHALEEVGLYRIPGSKTEVDQLIHAFDRGETVTIPQTYHGANLASLIVQFIKRSPENLFGDQLAQLFLMAADKIMAVADPIFPKPRPPPGGKPAVAPNATAPATATAAAALPVKQWAVGEECMAKWDDGHYYAATIQQVGDSYSVTFAQFPGDAYPATEIHPVWKVGDHCMATWTDGARYPALVTKVLEEQIEVNFTEYNELFTVNVNAIFLPPNPSSSSSISSSSSSSSSASSSARPNSSSFSGTINNESNGAGVGVGVGDGGAASGGSVENEGGEGRQSSHLEEGGQNNSTHIDSNDNNVNNDNNNNTNNENNNNNNNNRHHPNNNISSELPQIPLSPLSQQSPPQSPQSQQPSRTHQPGYSARGSSVVSRVFFDEDALPPDTLLIPQDKLDFFRKLIKKLPAVNRETLRVLCAHLAMVASMADINQMTPDKLAMCIFGSMGKPLQVCIRAHRQIFTDNH